MRSLDKRDACIYSSGCQHSSRQPPTLNNPGKLQMSTFNIRATLGTPNAKRGASQPKQPMVGAGSLVISMPDGSIREVITVRTYMSASRNASIVKACVWIKPFAREMDWQTGRGEAGGYGYHKESAAIAEAVSAAGVTLYGNPYSSRNADAEPDREFHFGGTGSSAYPEIFGAIARAAGYNTFAMEWISHGL